MGRGLSDDGQLLRTEPLTAEQMEERRRVVAERHTRELERKRQNRVALKAKQASAMQGRSEEQPA